jgi:hypothetical protein
MLFFAYDDHNFVDLVHQGLCVTLSNSEIILKSSRSAINSLYLSMMLYHIYLMLKPICVSSPVCVSVLRR